MSSASHPLFASSAAQPALSAGATAAFVAANPSSSSAPPSSTQPVGASSFSSSSAAAQLPGALSSASVPPSSAGASSAAPSSAPLSAAQSAAAAGPLSAALSSPAAPSTAAASASASSAAQSAAAAHSRTGELLFAASEKVNSELLAMTYGALVTQLIKDYKDVPTVNAELDKIGYNIGIRLVDEFLSRVGAGLQCGSFRDTALVIAKVAFKLFLGCTAEVGRWRADGRQCVLAFKGNPLLDFVELPPHLAQLNYSAVLTGCIRGACQMVQLNVTAEWLRDELKGAGESEIRLTLKEILQDEFADDEDK